MSYFSLFQSPHPVRGATGSRSCWPPSQCHFNPRTPRGVRLAPHAGGGAAILISIHAPREGCDTINQLRMAFQIQFQSTHPARGATSNDKRLEADELLFQSTHPARGATVCRRATMDVFTCFNPRTPRGVRPRRSAKPSWPLPFQSTHPARGATVCRRATMDVFTCFNPRTPRGVRRETCAYVARYVMKFQSTHPARGATRRRRAPREEEGISIHAPREGCDKTFLIKRCYNKNFNPRTPRGVRHDDDEPPVKKKGFQSTHPARGATAACGIL